MEPSRDFYAGLGALAYALAKADNLVDNNELKVYADEILSAFGDWSVETKGARATAMLENLLAKDESSEVAYKMALTLFTLDKAELRHFRQQLVDILVGISEADEDISEAEDALVKRFIADTQGV